MPYRRKNSPIWWVSYTEANGKRARRSTETSNRKEAEALEAKWKLEVFKIRQWNKEPTHSFNELLLGYLQETQPEKRSAERDRYIGRHLRNFFGGRELDTLSASDIRAYVQSRKVLGTNPATINRELAMLSAAINYARREWEWNIPNPVPGRKLRQAEGRARWISREEAIVLVTAAEAEPRAPHLSDFIRLALHTGCRKQELLGLEWKRVDLQGRLLFLEAHHTKIGRRRSVPINAIAREVTSNRLRFRLQHCPLSPWVFAHKDGHVSRM